MSRQLGPKFLIYNNFKTQNLQLTILWDLIFEHLQEEKILIFNFKNISQNFQTLKVHCSFVSELYERY